MRNVLIDTNVYSAFKRSRNDVVEAFRGFDVIALDSTVLAKLYSGFDSGTKSKKNREELNEFLNSKRVQILSHDQLTAEFYSRIFCSLKKKGTPIPTNDIWIAASSMQHSLALFTFDAHFCSIGDLLLYKELPASPA